MTARRNTVLTARDHRRAAALARPELRRPSDGFARQASASPFGAPVKVRSPEDQALIDKAVAERGGQH